jgi:hypothetical protein
MWEREQHFRKLSEALTKAARHRQFHWCRRPKGFNHLPIWRLVAAKLSLPLPYVVAFGNELEELANDAANKGYARGAVALFNAEEFGIGLGMSPDDAARIFVALEQAGWISSDHVADFYSRNPDKEDETAADRQRRKYVRDKIRKLLSKLAIQGKIAEPARRVIEAALMGISDPELLDLQTRLLRAEAAIDLSTAQNLTREVREVFEPSEKLSTGQNLTRESRTSRRENVSLTPEQSKNLLEAPFDNSGDADAVPGAGPAGAGIEPPQPPTGDATRWMDSDGRELIVLRLECTPQRAEQFIERWRRDLQDDAALKEIIQGAVSNLHSGARFHIVIADGVQRFIRAREQAGQLPLPGATRPISIHATKRIVGHG